MLLSLRSKAHSSHKDEGRDEKRGGLTKANLREERWGMPSSEVYAKSHQKKSGMDVADIPLAVKKGKRRKAHSSSLMPQRYTI